LWVIFALLYPDPKLWRRLSGSAQEHSFGIEEERPEEAKDSLEQEHEVALEESPHLLHDRGEGSHVVPKEREYGKKIFLDIPYSTTWR
jgi:hypothetical protein